MLSKMLEIVARAHSNQVNKGGQPYILHPISVMLLLGKDADEELRCIALGHDSMEDTYVNTMLLEREGFSSRVLRGIRALTKDRWQTYSEYKKAVFDNEDAMRVKLCDLKHNMDVSRLSVEQLLDPKTIERMEKYKKFHDEIVLRLK